MPKLFLVRHAKPAATWGQDPDPGLDPLGVVQAAETAEQLAAHEGSLPIYSSPLKRCCETALPLESLWKSRAELFPAAAEIPAPPLDLAARHEWLMQAMRGTWRQLNDNAPPGSPDYLAWRSDVLRSLARLRRDCVIYTHFIAINVVVGATRNTDDVVCFRPDHASITVVSIDGDNWRLESLGREANTSILTR